MTKPVLIAWSGGKDCLMALESLRADPEWHPVALLSTVTRVFDRVAMHGIRREVLEAQADALGLPLLLAPLDWPSSNTDYAAAQALALADAARLWPGLCHCAFGDLYLEDVRDYRESLLAKLGWQGVFPLWGEDTAALARRFLDEGHRARLTCVDTTQIDAAFSGQAFDADLLARLPPGADPCGENGEFHTLAYAGPAFAKPLNLDRGQSLQRDGHFQYTDFRLVDAF